MAVSRRYNGSVSFGAGACGNPGCPVVSFCTACGGGAGAVGFVCGGACVVGLVGLVCWAIPGCVHTLINNKAMLAAACISLNLTMRSPTLPYALPAAPSSTWVSLPGC